MGIYFNTKPFKVYHGRDVTYRNVLHRRGVNLDANDDGGISPFPRLSKLKAGRIRLLFNVFGSLYLQI